MQKNKIVVMAAAFIISLQIATAQSTIAPSMDSTPIQKVTKNDIYLIITRKAFVYGVNERTMNGIVSCESTYDIEATNINKKEESYGLVQINVKAHTGITKEQAKNPEFAIDFLAKKMKEGKADKMWYTCYKKAVELAYN